MQLRVQSTKVSVHTGDNAAGKTETAGAGVAFDPAAHSAEVLHPEGATCEQFFQTIECVAQLREIVDNIVGAKQNLAEPIQMTAECTK